MLEVSWLGWCQSWPCQGGVLHLPRFASLFYSDVEMFAGCVKHCVPQRCPTEIQAPFNEDILTVYESSNRPLSKAKTHFPAQFQTFNNFPDHCTGNQSGMNTKFGLAPIFLFVHLILVFLACFWETVWSEQVQKLHFLVSWRRIFHIFGLEGVAIFFVLIEGLGEERVSEDDLLGWGRNISAHLSFYFPG